MGMGLIKDSTLTGIADAIREKAGVTGKILPSQMAEMILGIGGGVFRITLIICLWQSLRYHHLIQKKLRFPAI